MHEECIVCHADLGDVFAPHLAVLDHYEGHPECAAGFRMWAELTAEGPGVD